MDLDLLNYDLEKFLDKYTRFMTKKMYISNSLYNNFLNQYHYLYDMLISNKNYYKNNKKYKSVISILDNKKGLIRLHNQKYLKDALKEYNNFFEDKLDIRKRMIVLAEEKNIYVVESKNYGWLVGNKISYLIGCKKYSEDSILVMVDSESKKRVISSNSIYNIPIIDIDSYSNKLLGDKRVVDNNIKYTIFIDHIVNELFSDKSGFETFYKAFSKYIYINKDYGEYDTFRDYHNYMYKRKYLASGFSLKKFNENEIRGRKKYLRTINNEILSCKEMVDIANFLTLNSIEYIYDKDNSLFKIVDSNINIKYVDKVDKKNTYKDNAIYLYPNNIGGKSYLEVLAYELIKNRYPLELALDKDIYIKLRDTNIDNYFSEFIREYLIQLVDYYDEFESLDNINISDNIKIEFLKLYEVYKKYLGNNNLITNRELYLKIENELNNSGYKYLFLVGDMPINCNIDTFTIVDDYPENELIKENVKLLYDYKKYLYEHQIIPIMHTFTSKLEIEMLTKAFLKDNLELINKSLADTKKNIILYEYNDANRLHIYSNISDSCSKILEQYGNNSVFAFSKLKDINILLNNNNFTKFDKETLVFKNKTNIRVDEINNIDKMSDNIILPYLIKDNYHDELFVSGYKYNIKVMIYITLNKCKSNLIILCPTSKIEVVKNVLCNLKVQVEKLK